MLKNYVLPELRRRNALNDIVWMQDGAPPHIARSVKGSWISILVIASSHAIIVFRGLRDPRSDPYGFLVWGYLKSTVYLLMQSSNIVGLKGFYTA
ncbi:hypothetical protein TNCV_4195821 [Trichonephila clavipes]|nr:hypothetical protein TNCV_4195821 [Trichonephila clavipes]